jgi:hypothetical protein
MSDIVTYSTVDGFFSGEEDILDTKDSGIYTNLLLIDSSVPDFHKFVDSTNDTTYPIVYSPASTKTQIFELIQHIQFKELHSFF